MGGFLREGLDGFAGWRVVLPPYKYSQNIIVRAGSKMNLGTIVYEPPRNGPTLWGIGVPHRLAAEFFVPDPYAKFKNPLFTGSSDKYRQDGLREQYADFYSNDDLKYTIGVSNYTQDWFFAHVTMYLYNYLIDNDRSLLVSELIQETKIVRSA
ncbi:hypothetical protein WN943_023579 [Citrus x changshan-huyou]